MKPAMRRLLFAAPFSPARWFRAGEQGVWYRPKEIATLYQDSAGTTPVTAATDRIGKILDKSGNGNHSIQATANDRLTWGLDATTGKYYFGFDGLTSSVASAATINFSGTNRITVVAGVYKASDAATAMLAEISVNATTQSGAWFLTAPNTNGGANYGGRVRGDQAGATVIPTGFAAPHYAVLSLQCDISADVNILRVNGNAGTSSATDQGAGNFGNHTLYIGRRAGATLPFNGNLYGLIVCGAARSTSEIARAERWMAAEMGISI